MPNEYINFFSKNLQQLLKHNDVTQSDLACKLGMTQSSISLYVKGERVPSLETIKKIEKFFCLDENDLCKSALIQVKKSSIRYRLKEIPLLSHKEIIRWVKEGVLPKNYKKEIVMLDSKADKDGNIAYTYFVGNYMNSPENMKKSIFEGDLLEISKDTKPTLGDLVAYITNADYIKFGEYSKDENGAFFLKHYSYSEPSIIVDKKTEIMGVVKSIVRNF